MRFKATFRKVREIGVFPIFLVLLLVARVAAYPSIQCQHALAEETQKIAQVATGIAYEAGDLCGLPQAAKDDLDRRKLKTQCPFFAAPVVKADEFTAFDKRYESYSRARPALSNARIASEFQAVGFNPRAPPALV